jgi:hypothetical protein
LLFTQDSNLFRSIQFRRDLRPQPYFAATVGDKFEIQKSPIAPSNILLPDNVKFYLKWWQSGILILRLHNVNQQHGVVVNVRQFNLLEETTMTGNQNWNTWIHSRYEWKDKGE